MTLLLIKRYHAVKCLTKSHDNLIKPDMNTTQVEADYNTINVDYNKLFILNFRNCMMHYDTN